MSDHTHILITIPVPPGAKECGEPDKDGCPFICVEFGWDEPMCDILRALATADYDHYLEVDGGKIKRHSRCLAAEKAAEDLRRELADCHAHAGDFMADALRLEKERDDWLGRCMRQQDKKLAAEQERDEAVRELRQVRIAAYKRVRERLVVMNNDSEDPCVHVARLLLWVNSLIAEEEG